MEELMKKLIDSMANGFSFLGHNVADALTSVWNVIMDTLPGKILGFLWDIIMFLLYGVRSIILLIWNLIYSIFNGFVNLFDQVFDTFTDLSYFMGSDTSLLYSLFSLSILIIVFGFLIRFFTGKYHFNNKR